MEMKLKSEIRSFGISIVNCQEKLYLLSCFVFSSLFLYIVHVNDHPVESDHAFTTHVLTMYIKVFLTCLMMSLYFKSIKNKDNKKLPEFKINLWFCLFYTLSCLFELLVSDMVYGPDSHDIMGYSHSSFKIVDTVILSFLVSLFSYFTVAFFMKNKNSIINLMDNNKKAKKSVKAKINDIEKAIPIEHIEYIKVEENYCYLWTTQEQKGEKYTLRKTLSRIVADLDDSHVVQVHRSYAINRNHIDSVFRVAGRVKVKMKSGVILPVTPIHVHKVSEQD
ncbi:hypothetical protein C3B51_00765 [Pseudoalteromonas rubra]|uniref:HTH LytTR-type domain-containing protein n=1 Tax=Pseudoalteromonas rubra TaxID=43658 RepID=A0A4Q7EM00_9GAMM|nr:LytTR family DNA-binding domain-containing protein [Pseudoalteromonas rubra]RZM85215.1 hypothetical protein C3B51_00765 [Pseudoalteromonas rubra]